MNVLTRIISGWKEGSQCHCPNEWEGHLCEQKKDFCSFSSSKCENGGVCRSLIGHFRCECLNKGEFFEGERCEIVHQKYLRLRRFSISSGSISVIVIVSFLLFFFLMDFLKYVLGIDPTEEEIRRIRQNKRRHRIERVFYRHHSDSLIPIERETDV